MSAANGNGYTKRDALWFVESLEAALTEFASVTEAFQALDYLLSISPSPPAHWRPKRPPELTPPEHIPGMSAALAILDKGIRDIRLSLPPGLDDPERFRKPPRVDTMGLPYKTTDVSPPYLLPPADAGTGAGTSGAEIGPGQPAKPKTAKAKGRRGRHRVKRRLMRGLRAPKLWLDTIRATFPNIVIDTPNKEDPRT
jgi:hypothetical protein